MTIRECAVDLNRSETQPEIEGARGNGNESALGSSGSIVRALPDVVANDRSGTRGRLDRVGMTGIESVATLRVPGGAIQIPARVDAFVSLDDPQARGIHMSRIVLAVEALLSARALSPGAVATLLHSIVEEQGPSSRSAELTIHVDQPVKRSSLRSGAVGTRIYPVRFEGSLAADGHIRAFVGTVITYSSSCPCSAALAQGLLQDQLIGRFGGVEKLAVAEVLDWLRSDGGKLPIPHSQRSRADVGVEVDWTRPSLEPLELIDRIEQALGTPVQAAVKRIDEQEFGRLNALNPLFCEDAARRIAAALEADSRVRSYRVEVQHDESLHAHNAVAAVASAGWSS